MMIRRGKSLRIVSTFMFIVKDKSDCFLEAGKERWSIIDLCLLSRPPPPFTSSTQLSAAENISWKKILFVGTK